MFDEYQTNFEQDAWRMKVQRQNNTYDALGRLLIQSKEYNSYTQDNYSASSKQFQTVDRWGNMLSYTNALGKQTLYEYTAFNEVERQELPEVTYMDERGQRLRIKPTNQYAYDELGRVIAMIDANEHLATKAYDAAGHLISETDAKKITRSKHYNLLNQLDYSINELHGKTSYTYDAANRLVKVVTPRTHQDYVYDEAGQLLQQRNGTGDTTTFAYDSLGNQIRRQDARGYQTYYDYDDAGRKIKETDALGTQQSWAYDADGRLVSHTDLGNHVTAYEYNTNGLLLHEYSSSGKSIRYYYQGDGQLIQYADEGRNEIVNYTYDAEGQMLSKTSSRAGDINDGWIREMDYYHYDDLGRLTQVRRRNPNDEDTRFPEEDKSLLSVDYAYDKVGNIRHTQVSARYRSHAASTSADYYLYDENNRMTTNKGQLVNGNIVVTASQGSSLEYDAAGNIVHAEQYEEGFLQKYDYGYNNDNQLELIQKNKRNLQYKSYDDAGRVTLESSFNERNQVAQRNELFYVNGVLMVQNTYEGAGTNVASSSRYEYDNVGNTTSWIMELKGGKGRKEGATITHKYTYELWDSYQQQGDEVTIEAYKLNPTHGSSTRIYNQKDGLLEASVDASVDENNRSNNINYLSSSLEGTRARRDKDGRTGYLTVAGKTIGDLRLDNSGTQHLTIYGGFTPSGSQFKWKPTSSELQSRVVHQQKIAAQFQRQPGDVADGTLPEVPQDNLGTYTLQAGDSLEHIALQVYGDSSLWYLIADANGIADRKAMAGHEGALHIGQRLTIPPGGTGQHHTNGTHKVLNANHLIGDTRATAAMPTPLPPKPKHHSIWSKIIVAVVAVVATVLTAGAIGMAAGITGSLFSAGSTVLAGGLASTAGSLASTAGSLAAGFSAGFVGSIASQGVASALGMQHGVDVSGALLTGLATAATAGVGHALNNVTAFQKMTNTLNQHSFEQFNLGHCR
ncbi:hypothetical protein LDG_5899 [Legionella drancourtii LLAP12]|uniref:LysM domain-containing protein n=1 Tax=Legionella drancourtii LLAP12 TaxID=658187 RepID=G9EL03_9GAMM|nr:hypothetical protein LDG_5899 [Legionella drancourtii LLAP12]